MKRKIERDIQKQTGRTRAEREKYLLRELQRIGYEVAQVAPYQFYIRKAAA